jgi:hypothetical protein
MNVEERINLVNETKVDIIETIKSKMSEEGKIQRINDIIEELLATIAKKMKNEEDRKIIESLSYIIGMDEKYIQKFLNS